MIGVDWGTTSCRAYRFRGVDLVERREASLGILQVRDRDFASVLREITWGWRQNADDRIILSGMIGSRQGWREAPYVACPATLADVARQLLAVEFEDTPTRIVPGVRTTDSDGVPDLMRGEETQVFGTGISDGLCCLPGTHSKWVEVRGGSIVGFNTHLTGELYALLRNHSILGKLLGAEEQDDEGVFETGVARSGDAGGLLHHLFGVRALGITGSIAPDQGSSYLSGLIIGHEVRAAAPVGRTVHVIGSQDLARRYARAIAACGGTPVIVDGDSAARGLARLAAAATWN
jgi:2-dehydro-3-deoxygalactonokinase